MSEDVMNLILWELKDIRYWSLHYPSLEVGMRPFSIEGNMILWMLCKKEHFGIFQSLFFINIVQSPKLWLLAFIITHLSCHYSCKECPIISLCDEFKDLLIIIITLQSKVKHHCLMNILKLPQLLLCADWFDMIMNFLVKPVMEIFKGVYGTSVLTWMASMKVIQDRE